ncbi:hypothetical protein [Mycetocola reblochoni]|uniref:2-phospho-L-lactate guanylyltransferase n=2 Tax=Mycetocola reblochoni TaxID=331618 RepID=A0A1R4ITZ0_9MICO|nr:hypothetical protein [Mycetocola reblochoni]RLP71037.1 2-phospho-L-lactate guanylyltransferase [Mycetocola reblochoni]SJN23357.1 hypothetical protein FM119_03595 [Mycetocola reblochoni REB411]
MGWRLIVPVKGTPGAKSRFAPWLPDPAVRMRLASALAADTVAAAREADGVDELVVVAGGAVLPRFPSGVRLQRQDPSRPGLAAAVEEGLAGLGDGPCAVLLGDLPALRPEEIALALGRADGTARGMVADADAEGTVLLTAAAPELLVARFGGASAARHVAEGHVPLVPLVPLSGPGGRGRARAVSGAVGGRRLHDREPLAGLRRDVDGADALRLADELGLGPATTALLERAQRSGALPALAS